MTTQRKDWVYRGWVLTVVCEEDGTWSARMSDAKQPWFRGFGSEELAQQGIERFLDRLCGVSLDEDATLTAIFTRRQLLEIETDAATLLAVIAYLQRGLAVNPERDRLWHRAAGGLNSLCAQLRDTFPALENITESVLRSIRQEDDDVA